MAHNGPIKLGIFQCTLKNALQFLGLQSRSSISNYTAVSLSQTLRALFVLLLSLAAFLYELTANINYLITPRERSLQISDIVQTVTYIMKTATTLAILLTFWRKSPILACQEQYHTTRPSNTSQQRGMSTEELMACLTLVTFTVYNVALATMRFYKTFTAQEWPVTEFPLFAFNTMQEEMFVLFVRNFTESLRLLCSGHVGIFLVRFNRNLASGSRILLQDIRRRGSAITVPDLEKIWSSRESALSVAGHIQNELGTLVTYIFVTDIVCLVCVVGEGFNDTTLLLIRLVATCLLYLVSMACITAGLIGLKDTDDETLDLLHKLQSSFGQRMLSHIALRWDNREVLTRKPCHLQSAPQTDLIAPLEMLTSACFGSRKVVLTLIGFGHISRGTLMSVFGFLVTFFCFLLDQEDGRSTNPASKNATCLC